MSTPDPGSNHATPSSKWGAFIMFDVTPAPTQRPRLFVPTSCRWFRTRALAVVWARLEVHGKGGTRYAIARFFP